MKIKELKQAIKDADDEASIFIFFDTKPVWSQRRVTEAKMMGGRLLIEFEGSEDVQAPWE